MNIGQRIKALRIQADMTLEELSKKVGVSRQTLSRYETGVIGNIPSDKIEALAVALQSSPAIIMGWDDESLFSAPTVTEDVIQFHPIGTVAAGYNECAFEEVQEDFIDIPVSYLKGRPRSDYFLLKVKGDSMYPLYHDGDHVLVLKQDSLERPGEIGVVLYDGDQATLKKVEFGDGWMRLVPINPTYKELMIEKADLNRCRILGIPRVLIRDM